MPLAPRQLRLPTDESQVPRFGPHGRVKYPPSKLFVLIRLTCPSNPGRIDVTLSFSPQKVYSQGCNPGFGFRWMDPVIPHGSPHHSIHSPGGVVSVKLKASVCVKCFRSAAALSRNHAKGCPVHVYCGSKSPRFYTSS